MYGLDLWLPMTDATSSRLADVTGNGHNGALSPGGTASFPGLVGTIPGSETVTLPNASGRPAFGFCAYFPAGGMPYNGGFFYGRTDPAGVGQRAVSLNSVAGPGYGILNGFNGYFPQLARTDAVASTVGSSGYSGVHCIEGVDGGSLDHMIVDGAEVNYEAQGTTSDVVGADQASLPMYIAGGNGNEFGFPIVVYSTWAATRTDSVAIAKVRTQSEIARLESLGVVFGAQGSIGMDSVCAIDGTSIDQGFFVGVAPSSLLNLDFPCTIFDFSQSGQPSRDIDAAFQDREGRVYHSQAARNIAYNGGVVNSVVRFMESPAAALQDVLDWNKQAHAEGYKTIVSTMMSDCGTGYNGETGDQLAQQFNALLLANSDSFDWVDNLAAWPLLGATGACSGSAFGDGVHPNGTVGQPLYVANERAGFEGVYGSTSTTVSSAYTQVPSDRLILASGSLPYSITLLDANTASFNSAGKVCVQNNGSSQIQLLPVGNETVDGASSLPIPNGAPVCVRPVVADPTQGGANWTVH
jgi:hypothetical protein